MLLALSPMLAFADIAYLAVDDNDFWQAWVMDDNGENNQQITSSTFDKTRLSWYPDGKALFVNAADGKLYRVELKRQQPTEIKTELHGMLDAMLSPDGKTFVFSLSTSDSLDDNNIWLAAADGSNLRKITQMQHMQHEPVWSLDGKFIYFLSGDGDQAHDIWRLDVASKSTQQLTVKQLYNFDIAPRPKNHPKKHQKGQLAFSSNRSGNYEIWLKPEQEPARQLTDNPALDARPSWLPGGEALVFSSSRGGGMNIWQLDLQTNTLKQLTRHAKGARFPVVCCHREVQ